jgi:N-acetylglucosamine-6-sulfatase
MAPPPTMTVVRSSVVALLIAVSTSTVVMSTRGSDPVQRPSAPIQAVTTSQRPDIVLILTDDQRFDTLWAMPTVRSELVAKGIEFTNGYVSNPVCCPSRSSILTGQYSHSTGVYTNHPKEPFGGFPAFHDTSTVATWLQGSGYRTALMGKYLNGYADAYIPPGWDRWFVTWDGGAYFDYSANDDGILRSYGSDPEDYGTDVLVDQATDLIRSTDREQPLFLYFAPHAAHGPATPAPRDDKRFADLEPWRPESYDEADVSDKPAYVRSRGRMSRSTSATIERFRRDQYRSLRSVDRAVSEILDALTDTGRLSNALIVFTSDNGMLWGEHRWSSKVVPYEESIRVPFVIRDDAIIGAPRRDDRLVLNVDLAPTFADLAGVPAQDVEGRSLVPLLSNSRALWRKDFLMEHLEIGPGGVPTYCGVHSRRYVYIDYATGEEELYDLDRDPLQLANVAGSRRYRDVLRTERGRLRELCRPRPPGFAISY